MNKQTIAIIILSILLVGCLLFYGYNYIYQQGYNQALNQTSISLYNQFLNSAITCIPLTIPYNQTKLNFYWEGCYKF